MRYLKIKAINHVLPMLSLNPTIMAQHLCTKSLSKKGKKKVTKTIKGTSSNHKSENQTSATFKNDEKTSTIYKSRPVSAPRIISYDQECMNTAVITGIIIDKPESKYNNDLLIASCNVLIPPFPSTKSKAKATKISVSFYDFSAEQVLQHLKENDKVMIKGTLKGYGFGRCVLSSRDFAIIDNDTWSITDEQITELKNQIKINKDYTSNFGSGDEQSQQRNLGNYKMKLSSRKKSIYNAYMKGKNFTDIATENKIQPATVLIYIANAAISGLEVDFKRLCKDALLGMDGKTVIEIDKIYNAIETVKKTNQYEKIEDMKDRDVVKYLYTLTEPEMFTKVDDVMKNLLYAQVNIVFAMIIKGLKPENWNELLNEQCPF